MSRSGLIAVRSFTGLGDQLWNLSFPLLLYMMTASPVWVAVSETIKYLTLAAVGLLFPRVLATRVGTTRAYLVGVGLQVVCVVAAGASLAVADGRHDYFIGAVMFAAVAAVGGKFVAVLVETRVSHLLTHDAKQQERLVKLLPRIDSLSALVIAAGMCWWLYTGAELALADLSRLSAFLGWLVAANLITFAVEALAVFVFRLPERLQPPVVRRARTPVPPLAWGTLAAATLIWVTVLYPGANLIGTVHHTYGGGEVPLWVVTGLGAVCYGLAALGNWWANYQSCRCSLVVGLQACCLVAGCVVLSDGQPHCFLGLLVVSRMFIGIYHPTYRALLLDLADRYGSVGLADRAALHATLVGWDQLLSNATHVVILFMYAALVGWWPPGGAWSALQVAACVSAGAVATSALIWIWVERGLDHH